MFLSGSLSKYSFFSYYRESVQYQKVNQYFSEIS